MIDNVATIVKHVGGNLSTGFIVNSDLTLTPTYVAKCGNCFAHGATREDAMRDAQDKYNENLPVEERIRMFNEAYPDRDKSVPAKELFDWHHTLTGSCEQGRIAFCEDRCIDLKNGKYTVNQFIELTKDSYGGDVIKRL